MLLTAILCVTVYILVTAWLRHYFSYWVRRGIPYIEPESWVGHLPRFFFLKQYIGEAYQAIYEKSSGLKMVGIFLVFKPILMIRDPEEIKNVLCTKFSHFTGRDIELDKNLEITAYNLFFNQDAHQWKSTRIQLTHFFSPRKLKHAFRDIVSCSTKLFTQLERRTNEPIDVKEIMSDYTTDVAFSSFFGLETRLLDDDLEAGSALRELGLSFVKPKAITLLHNILSCFPGRLSMICKIPILPLETTNFFLNLLDELLEYRKSSGFSREDLFNQMINMTNLNNLSKGKKKDKMNAAAQCSLFYAAGFETTSFTISSCLHALAHNPEVQEKLEEEILACKGIFTYESLKKLKYLDMVINETLRLFPPVPELMRKCTKEYTTSDGQRIEVGTRVVIPIHAIHRDASHFPNPMYFDPERWQNPSNHKYVYLPFGHGPRSCIGMRMGLVQVKYAVVRVLSQYRVYPDSRSPYPPTYAAGIFVSAYNENGFWLKLQEREH